MMHALVAHVLYRRPKKHASGSRALFLIGVVATLCTTFIPSAITEAFLASRLAEAGHSIVCPPQWLPMLLASRAPTRPKGCCWTRYCFQLWSRFPLCGLPPGRAIPPDGDVAPGDRIFPARKLPPDSDVAPGDRIFPARNLPLPTVTSYTQQWSPSQL